MKLWDETLSKELKCYIIEKSAEGAANSVRKLLVDRPAIRSVCLAHGRLVMGTKNGEILEISREGHMELLLSVSICKVFEKLDYYSFRDTAPANCGECAQIRLATKWPL